MIVPGFAHSVFVLYLAIEEQACVIPYYSTRERALKFANNEAMRGYCWLLTMLVTSMVTIIVDGFLSAPGRAASTGEATGREPARASSTSRWPDSRYQIGVAPTKCLTGRVLSAARQDTDKGGGLLEAMRHVWRQFERDASTYSMMKVNALSEC